MKQEVLAFLMNPNIAFILFSIGMLALYGEFNNPGSVLPGVVGVVFILLAVFALNILPVRFAALALIVAAFVLFGLEVKFTTHGLLGIGGTVLMVIGAMLLVDGPIPEMRVKFLTAISVSVPLALITIFLTTIAYRAHRGKVQTGPQAMIGSLAIAKSPLTPAGKVELDGELWNAIASSPVAIGDKVVVREVKGLELEVDKA
jgi:membrane-bound serine protease (ClpP class)